MISVVKFFVLMMQGTLGTILVLLCGMYMFCEFTGQINAPQSQLGFGFAGGTGIWFVWQALHGKYPLE